MPERIETTEPAGADVSEARFKKDTAHRRKVGDETLKAHTLPHRKTNSASGKHLTDKEAMADNSEVD